MLYASKTTSLKECPMDEQPTEGQTQIDDPELRRSILTEIVSKIESNEYLCMFICVERKTGQISGTWSKPQCVNDLLTMIEAANKQTIGNPDFLTMIAKELNESAQMRGKIVEVMHLMHNATVDDTRKEMFLPDIQKAFGEYKPPAIEILRNRRRQKLSNELAAKRALPGLLLPTPGALLNADGRPLIRN